MNRFEEIQDRARDAADYFKTHWKPLVVGGAGVVALGWGVYEYTHFKFGRKAATVPPEGVAGNIPTPESPPAASSSSGTPEASGITAVPGTRFSIQWNGTNWECMRMNNPKFPGTFDSTLPIVRYPLMALRQLGDVTTPYILVRGSDGVLVINDFNDIENTRSANGTWICADLK